MPGTNQWPHTGPGPGKVLIGAPGGPAQATLVLDYVFH